MDTSQHQESGPERAADEPVSAPHRRRRGVWVTTAAAVALGLAVTGGAVAGAATGSSTTSTTPDHHGLPGGHGGFGGAPPAAFGTVKSVGTDTFTLTAHDGTTVTVDVSSSTKYMEFGKASATLSDVTVGTQVVVFGTDTSNTVTATSVGIGGQGNGPSGSFHPGGPGWRPSSGAPSGSSGGTAWGNAGLN